MTEQEKQQVEIVLNILKQAELDISKGINLDKWYNDLSETVEYLIGLIELHGEQEGYMKLKQQIIALTETIVLIAKMNQ